MELFNYNDKSNNNQNVKLLLTHQEDVMSNLEVLKAYRTHEKPDAILVIRKKGERWMENFQKHIKERAIHRKPPVVMRVSYIMKLKITDKDFREDLFVKQEKELIERLRR